MSADTGRINITQQGKAAATALANAFAQCDQWVANINSLGGTYQTNLNTADLTTISSTSSLSTTAVLAFLQLVKDVQAVRASTSTSALSTALSNLSSDLATLLGAGSGASVDSVINAMRNG
jgi:hypothetical protein